MHSERLYRCKRIAFQYGRVQQDRDRSRHEAGLADLLLDTPFLEWLPVRELELQPLVPGAELACVLLGALIPCLLGFCVIRAKARRVVFVLAVLGVGMAATALSAALSYGPMHAWAWVELPVQIGLALALVVALLLLGVPERTSAALMLLALGVFLPLWNMGAAAMGRGGG